MASLKHNVRVPFVCRGSGKLLWAIWHDIKEERFLPKKVSFDGDLWELHTGKGSTYYMLARGQLWLPGVDLNPISFTVIEDEDGDKD